MTTFTQTAREDAFHVSLPDVSFEGPLDLLLHLIRQHELDILDLPIAFVTERYVEYLEVMRQLDLDVASEYLLMAATLAHIKSKTLLPRPPADQDDELVEEVDPRAELIRRLLEYQKYRRAAEQLAGGEMAGRDVFPRGSPAPQAAGPAPLAAFGVFKLIDAFQKIVARSEAKISLEVSAERITIQQRITEITDRLRSRRRSRFDELFAGVTANYDIVVTFLALLEMAKSQMIALYQSAPDAPLHLELRLLDATAEDVDADAAVLTTDSPSSEDREESAHDDAD